MDLQKIVSRFCRGKPDRMPEFDVLMIGNFAKDKIIVDGVEQIMQKHPAMSQAARDHAIRTFHVNSWIDHHAAVFHNLLAS